jgi:hypothetical protein
VPTRRCEGLDEFARVSYSKESIAPIGTIERELERAMGSLYYRLGYAYRFCFTERTGETRADELRS